MKKFNVITTHLLIIFSSFLISCNDKKDDPAPTTSTPSAQPVIVSSGFITGSYTLGTTTYSTTFSSQSTYKPNSHDFYILTVQDDAGVSFCEFWFASKPAAGTYTITSFLNGYLNGFGSNAGVVATPGTTATLYYSQNYATTTTLDVSLSGTDLVVTVSGLSLVNSKVSTDTKSFTTTSTFP